MATTAHDLLMDADLFRRVYPDWPHGGPAPEYVSPAPAGAPEAAPAPRISAGLLAEYQAAETRCGDCNHLLGCSCPHYCTPREI